MQAMLGPGALAELGLPDAAAVERLDRRARAAFAEVPDDFPSPETDAFGVVMNSARYLEQWRGFAAIVEAVSLSGAKTYGEVAARAEEILRRARLLARIEPLSAFTSDPAFREVVERASRRPQDPDELYPVTLSPSFIRAVSSILEFCPIAELVELGRRTGHQDVGHRCRLSYDWLRAYVSRHTPGERETYHVVGHAYAEGRLSLDEAAHLLSMPRVDAIAWLEDHGYARDVAVIRLSAEEREQRISQLRAERRARAGAPHPRPGMVARDVIATQRIEGVDARPWLPPEA